MPDVLELDGQWAVVTGASQGIGQAIARRFVQAGANVVAVARGRERLEDAVAEMRAEELPGRSTHAITADVSQQASIDELFDQLETLTPELNVFVANAGTGRASSFLDLSLEEWREILDLNLTGTFLSCQAAARFMTKLDDQQDPNRVILTVSSIRSESTLPGRMAYSAAKAGVNQMMRSMARELASHRIRANTLSPGITATALTDREDQRPLFEAAVRTVPLGRATTTSELAEAALYLCSGRGSFITGANLVVDGGESLV